MQRPRGIVGEQHQERIVQGQKIICGLVWANSFSTICSQKIWIVLVEAEPAPGLKAELKFYRRHWGIWEQTLVYEHSKRKPMARELPPNTS